MWALNKEKSHAVHVADLRQRGGDAGEPDGGGRGDDEGVPRVDRQHPEVWTHEGGRRASADLDGDVRPHPQWQDADHGRAVRGDEGAAGRLLLDRGKGPGRGDQDRRADPLREERHDRGAAGPGVRRLRAATMPAPGLSSGAVSSSRETIESVFKKERGRILATLIR